MALIRDANVLIGALEGGELVQELSETVRRVLATLKDHAAEQGKKGKAKGRAGVVLDFTVEEGSVSVRASIIEKVPARERGRDFFWVTDDGQLSTEHPKQTRLEFGVRAAS